MVHDLVEWSEPQRLRVLLNATCAISTNNERTEGYVKEFGMPYSLKKGQKL